MLSITKKTQNPARLIAVADAARDRRDWRAAATAYTQALKIDTSLTHIWVQLGHALKEGGQPTEALDAYCRAASLAPESGEIQLQMGHALKVVGDLSGAAAAYQAAVEREPELVDAVSELRALRLKGYPESPARSSRTVPLPRAAKPSKSGAVQTHPSMAAAVVTVVGKLGKTNGIGVHSNAFIATLKHLGTQLQIIDTRPDESDARYRNALGQFKLVDSDSQVSPSLVSIFCDVVANSETDANYLKTPESIVRLAYAVFDSSRLPEFWVSRLNTFDGILVPDPCLLPVMKNSGVERPVFVLPLALDYSHLERLSQVSPAQNVDTFVFGCIAGFGLRKNLYNLISVFVDVFGTQENVSLHIHSTLNFSDHYGELVDYVNSIGAKNVHLSCQVLSEKQYADLLNSFDVYVSVSKGEGFSITPREALYLGKPTILSDNTAHKTINNTGLTIPIPTASFEPAVYEGLDDRQFGYQCVPDLVALRQALSRAILESRRMRGQAAEMRRFAESFSINSLRGRYSSITSPKDVFLGNENEIYESHIVTSDSRLYDGLSRVRDRLKAVVKPSDLHRISVIGHDGGFFSLFNTFVSYLVWNIGRPEIASIVPDWRISEIQRHRKIDRFTSFCYGKRHEGNLWLKFFYPVPGQEVDEASYNDHAFLSEAVVYDKFNEDKEPLLTYIHAYQLYKTPGFAQWRRWYGAYVKKFVKFREHITTQADIFATAFDGSFVIGCHVRHPSHSIEQPGGRLPTVELFQQIIINRAAGNSNWKVFLATDQQSVIDSFKKLFGNRLMYRSDVARVQHEDDKLYNTLSAAEREKEGHQIQHLTASDESRWSTLMGDEVIVDALLLAKCECFVHVTSNIATAVSFLNPEIEMIYCE